MSSVSFTCFMNESVPVYIGPWYIQQKKGSFYLIFWNWSPMNWMFWLYQYVNGNEMSKQKHITSYLVTAAKEITLQSADRF